MTVVLLSVQSISDKIVGTLGFGTKTKTFAKVNKLLRLRLIVMIDDYSDYYSDRHFTISF